MYERFSLRWVKFVNVEIVDERVTRVFFSDTPVKSLIRSNLTEELMLDMTRYFKGEIVDFSKYEVGLKGLSDFTVKVLERVRKIPYGEVVTYGDLARELGTSPRAVGQALKRNPVPVVVPCHRVVGRDGLGGFSCGLNLKIKLLELELKQKLKKK